MNTRTGLADCGAARVYPASELSGSRDYAGFLLQCAYTSSAVSNSPLVQLPTASLRPARKSPRRRADHLACSRASCDAQCAQTAQWQDSCPSFQWYLLLETTVLARP